MELQHRAAKYALLPEAAVEAAAPGGDEVKDEVLSVLTAELGHSRTEALALIEAAMKRRPSISTAEELFDEVYRGARG